MGACAAGCIAGAAELAHSVVRHIRDGLMIRTVLYHPRNTVWSWHAKTNLPFCPVQERDWIHWPGKHATVVLGTELRNLFQLIFPQHMWRFVCFAKMVVAEQPPQHFFPAAQSGVKLQCLANTFLIHTRNFSELQLHWVSPKEDRAQIQEMSKASVSSDSNSDAVVFSRSCRMKQPSSGQRGWDDPSAESSESSPQTTLPAGAVSGLGFVQEFKLVDERASKYAPPQIYCFYCLMMSNNNKFIYTSSVFREFGLVISRHTYHIHIFPFFLMNVARF